MKETLYDKIYRIWAYGGGEEIIAYDKDNNPIIAKSISGDMIWEYGIKVGDREYTLDSMAADGFGPDNYADLFTGRYNLIKEFADAIKIDLGLED